MNIYKNMKDTAATDQWLRSQGLNPRTCINPDLDAKFTQAKRAAHHLLKTHKELLNQQQLEQIKLFQLKQTKVTFRQIIQILNLYKKVRRQIYGDKV
jgi:hypothetical protein